MYTNYFILHKVLYCTLIILLYTNYFIVHIIISYTISFIVYQIITQFGELHNKISAVQRRSTCIAITSILKFISHSDEIIDNNAGRSYIERIVQLCIFPYHSCQPVSEFPCGRT